MTALIEAGAGLALFSAPALPVRLLFGTALEAPTASTIGRLTGAALLSLGVACWQARNDGGSRAARGLVAALLLYNGTAVALLAHAGIASGLLGAALWPGIILHVAMAAWCIGCLRAKRAS